MCDNKVDYARAVVDAVKQQLIHCGADADGTATASRSGHDLSLAGKVTAMRSFLATRHSALGLQEWDASKQIGLPSYEKAWGSLKRALKACSPEWRAFHQRWVLPQIELQRSGSKRQRKEAVPDELLDADFLDSLFSDGVTIEGVQLFDGKVRCKSVETAGADGAELVKKLSPGEDISPRQVVGLLPTPGEGSDAALGVTLTTDGAIRLGVVSEKPGVLGNVPLGTASDDAYSVKVVFAGWQGRVPVNVTGSVAVGNVVVPSGLNDGTAAAVPEADADGRLVIGIVEKIEHSDSGARVVHMLMGTSGLALAEGSWDMCDSSLASWPASDKPSDGSDKGSVGSVDQLLQMLQGGDDVMAMLQKLQSEMQAQKDKVAALQAEQEKMKVLEAENQALRDQLAAEKPLASGSPARQALLAAAMVPALRCTSSVVIQRVVRRVAAQRRLRLALRAARALQSIWRGRFERLSSCAVTIQAAARCYIARSIFAEHVDAAIGIQQSVRRRLCQAAFQRKRTATLRIQLDYSNHVLIQGSALRIERVWRGYRARRWQPAAHIVAELAAARQQIAEGHERESAAAVAHAAAMKLARDRQSAADGRVAELEAQLHKAEVALTENMWQLASAAAKLTDDTQAVVKILDAMPCVLRKSFSVPGTFPGKLPNAEGAIVSFKFTTKETVCSEPFTLHGVSSTSRSIRMAIAVA